MYCHKLTNFDIPGIGHIVINELPAPSEFPHLVACKHTLSAEPVKLRQVHGGDAHYIGTHNDVERTRFSRGDALVTSVPEIPIAVVTADCIPVILAHRSAAAVVHCSWRSIAAGVVENTLDLLKESAGIPLNELHCVMGPGILGDEYEVGAEVAEHFPQSISELPSGKFLLDLPAEVAIRLKIAGVLSQNVAVPLASTFKERWLPSYRREGNSVGRMTTAVWLE